jgi:hypothetical protein
MNSVSDLMMIGLVENEEELEVSTILENSSAGMIVEKDTTDKVLQNTILMKALINKVGVSNKTKRNNKEVEQNFAEIVLFAANVVGEVRISIVEHAVELLMNDDQTESLLHYFTGLFMADIESYKIQRYQKGLSQDTGTYRRLQYTFYKQCVQDIWASYNVMKKMDDDKLKSIITNFPGRERLFSNENEARFAEARLYLDFPSRDGFAVDKKKQLKALKNGTIIKFVFVKTCDRILYRENY